jgi:hypothetical protein
VSANSLLYYSFLVYGTFAGNSNVALQRKNMLGNNIAIPLVIVGLIGAIVGKGAGRNLLAFAVVLGFLLWIGVGVL